MKTVLRMLLAGLAMMLAGAPAAGKWREAESEHFIIYSEQSVESLQRFTERLERYDSAMRYLRRLGDPPVAPANKLTIYVVSTVGAVQKLAGKGSRHVMGFYIPRATGSVAVVPRRGEGSSDFALTAQTVLLHEYAHHFMFNNYAAAYPAWFSEGFAEFYGTARFDDDGSVSLGVPAAHRALGLVSGNPLPIEKMMGLGTERLNDAEREAVYGRGWLLTHYLTFEAKRDGQLARFLVALNSGKKGIDAAREAFGDLKQLDRELANYLKRRTLHSLKIPPHSISIGAVKVRELGPGEDSVMELKIRSRRGVDRTAALELVPLMRRAAGPYPNDPSVQATLAEAEYDAGNHEEAEAAADRALAAAPKNMDALIYKGRARMALAEESKDPKAWAEVRRWLVAANRVDPDDPEPLLLFYQSFQAAGAKPTQNAVVGLNRAYQLAPQDRGLRMQVAHQFLVDNKPAEARVVLAPLAFDPHAGALAEVASAVVAQIDGGSAAAALTSFAEGSSKESEED